MPSKASHQPATPQTQISASITPYLASQTKTEARTLALPPSCATAPPTNWFFPPGFGGVAAIIAAGIAFFASQHSAKTMIFGSWHAAKTAADEENKRISDQRKHVAEGVKRQVFAMTKMVGRHLLLGYRCGNILTEDWEPTYTLLRNRLLQAETTQYLNDEIASSLYEIMGNIELSLSIAKRNEHQWINEDKERRERDKRGMRSSLTPFYDPPGVAWDDNRIKHSKGLFHKPCERIWKFWKSVGDEEEASRFEEVFRPL